MIQLFEFCFVSWWLKTIEKLNGKIMAEIKLKSKKVSRKEKQQEMQDKLKLILIKMCFLTL